MARGGLCGRCGGRRRGSQARAAQPVTTCSRCSEALCTRHARFDTVASEDVCTTCTERFDLTVIKISG